MRSIRSQNFAIWACFVLFQSGCCDISAFVMNEVLSVYIHNLDPILVEIPGTAIAVRWYGLAYLAGFVLGYLLLLHLSKKKLYCIEPEKLSDFIAMQVCLVGVVCGGRLGEFFFYWLPQHGISGFFDDPFWVFRVWEGGMASHGGIIGVILMAWFYASRNKLSFPRVLDGLAIAAPIGLCFGRIANFINGELWGKECARDNALAVMFPQEGGYAFNEWFAQLPAEAQARVAEQMLTPRYPSQLFEALGEGLLLFAVLIIVRLRWKNAPAGLFAGLFGVLYAIARVVCECFKQPDDAVWYGVTKGQWLSFGIFAAGVAFLLYAFRHKNQHDLQKK